MFENRKDDELPKGWRNAGRHSSQGWSLTDLVGCTPVIRLLKELEARASRRAVHRGIVRKASLERAIMRLDNRFKSHFFAGRFGKVDMVEAAKLYIDVLSDGLTVRESERYDLRRVLEIGNLHTFKVWLLRWGKALPATEFQTEALMYNLKAVYPGVSSSVRAVAKEWFVQHPNASFVPSVPLAPKEKGFSGEKYG